MTAKHQAQALKNTAASGQWYLKQVSCSYIHTNSSSLTLYLLLIRIQVAKQIYSGREFLEGQEPILVCIEELKGSVDKRTI